MAHVSDAAQRKRADGAIEAAALERESFAAENPVVNLDLRLPDQPLRQAVHPGVRIDRRDSFDLGRVMGKIQARPEADLQNVAAGRGEQVLPMFRHERPVQEEVTKPREDDLRVEPHQLLLAWGAGDLGEALLNGSTDFCGDFRHGTVFVSLVRS